MGPHSAMPHDSEGSEDPTVTNHDPNILTSGQTSEHEDPPIDSDDDYLISDDDMLSPVISSDEQRQHFAYGSTGSQNVDYFEKSLSYAMESAQMDKCLVAQAQLSGQLNDKNQKLMEKQAEIIQKLASLRKLHEFHIVSNKVGDLENDIKEINIRLNRLKHGIPKTLIFKNNGTIGIADRFPVEYNKAKDKVLERVSDS